MRVVAGSAKGRPLRATRAKEMRPTTDLMRRVIFDILGDTAHDAEVLDLFAGAGTLGIEALSRGASAATFVERDPVACRVIARNLEATGMTPRGSVRRSDVLSYLRRKPRRGFHLVFLDPPYEAGLAFLARVLDAVAAGGWVREGGTVVVEAEVGQVVWPSGFREIRIRRSGRTQVSMAVRDGERDDGDLSGDL